MARPSSNSTSNPGRGIGGFIGLGSILAAAVLFVAFTVVEDTFDPFGLVLAAPNLLVGVAILLRAQWHRIGWLLALIGLGLLISSNNLDLTLGNEWTLVMGQFVGVLVWVGYALLILLFPNGHLPPTRVGRAWGRVALTLVWVSLPIAVLVPTLSTEEGVVVNNPIGVAFLPDLDVLGYVLVWLALGGSLVGLFLRLRNADLADRNQYKVVIVPFVSLAVYMVGVAVAFSIWGDLPEAIWLLPVIMYLSIPVCFGIAILRFRLFDIDRVLSRAVTYLLVATVVATVYISAVLILPAVLGIEGDLAVAASTLLAAAAFNPVRVRVARAVEKRFNRARYNGQRELEEFASRLQLAPQIGSVDREIELVLGRTMQPISLGIWVKD